MIQQRVERALTATLLAASLALSNLGWNGQLGQRLSGAVVGLGLAALFAWVWGERTRPKASFLWWAFGLLVLGGGVAGGVQFYLPLALGLIVGLFLVHDMRLTPTLMLSAGIAAVLWQPSKRWALAPDDDAWWVGLSVLAAVVAALVERDRLAQRQGPPIPWVWTGMRVGFLTVWTVAVLSAKKDLQVGRIFLTIGIDPGLFGGKVALLAVLLFCLIVAGLLFRTKPQKVPQTWADASRPPNG